VLSWNNVKANATSAKVVGYELFAYHHAMGNEKKEWKKIGDGTKLIYCCCWLFKLSI